MNCPHCGTESTQHWHPVDGHNSEECRDVLKAKVAEAEAKAERYREALVEAERALSDAGQGAPMGLARLAAESAHQALADDAEKKP